jgi:hypothetical protein
MQFCHISLLTAYEILFYQYNLNKLTLLYYTFFISCDFVYIVDVCVCLVLVNF